MEDFCAAVIHYWQLMKTSDKIFYTHQTLVLNKEYKCNIMGLKKISYLKK